MKTLFSLLFCLLTVCATASAGVFVTPTGVAVSGVIDGDLFLPHPFDGDTIDYLTFEVTTRGPIRLIGTNIDNSVFLAMGRIVPGDPQFDTVPLPYVLFANLSPPPPEFTHTLDPGIYLVQIAEERYRDGDLGYEFLPVNRQGGGFVRAPYSFALEGTFTPLDFMEGNLDGTFTITQVPEPSIAALLCLAATAGFVRRRHR